MSDKGLLKPTLIITFCSIIGIIITFVSQMVIAYYFGASTQRDAYFAAMAIPTYLLAIFSGSLSMIFLPKYVDVLHKEGEQSAKDFLGNTLGFSFLLTLIVVILFTVFAKHILAFTAPGFDNNNQVFTKKLLVILLPSIIFQIPTTILSSILQINHKFVIPAIAPLVGAILSLAIVLLFSSRIGISSLAIGSLVSSIIILTVIYYSLNRMNFAIRLRFNFKDQNLKALILIAMPLFIGGIIFRLMPVFERMIASTLPQGSISYLGYANQMLGILASVISSGIAITFFPRMSKAYSESDIISMKNSFLMALSSILLITIPIAVIFYIYGVPIIQILLERGAFTHVITIAVYSTFIFLLGAFIFQSLGNIVMKVFYISNRTIWASSISILEIVSYLLGGLWLCKAYSYKGLAIAQSISTGISIFIALILVNKLLFKINKQNIKSFLKIIFSNLAFLLFLSLLNIIWRDFNSITIILKIFVGLIFLYILLWILKVHEVIQLKNIIEVKIKSIFNIKKK